MKFLKTGRHAVFSHGRSFRRPWSREFHDMPGERLLRVAKWCRRRTSPMVRMLRFPVTGTKAHPDTGWTAMAETADTPTPAATMARIVENWPLSNATLGCVRDSRHAAIRWSRKQWPSFKSRNGSSRSSASRMSSAELSRGSPAGRQRIAAGSNHFRSVEGRRFRRLPSPAASSCVPRPSGSR